MSSTKVLVHNQCGQLKYAPHVKHATNQAWNGAGIMDLSDDVAQTVLNNSISIGNKRFGYYNNKIYQFMNDNAGGWHGFLADYTDKTTVKAINSFKSLGIINKKTMIKLLKGK